MKPTKVLTALALVFALCPAAARAQHPRTTSADTATAHPAPPPAPATVKAKYEGGYSGYMKKQTGSINFDDPSRRLVFRDKEQREYFSLPYDALSALWPDTRAVTSTTARVMQNVPIFPVGLGSLLVPKNKQRYLVVQYDDPDTKARGTASFKLENKEILASVLNTLAQKSDMKARGEGFVRQSKDADNNK